MKVITMNLEEFEAQYRDKLDQSLNQLQAAVLLLTQLEATITDIGHNLHSLSQTVEEYLTQQQAE